MMHSVGIKLLKVLFPDLFDIAKHKEAFVADLMLNYNGNLH
jgi:hypothetical protein